MGGNRALTRHNNNDDNESGRKPVRKRVHPQAATDQAEASKREKQLKIIALTAA